MLSVILTSRLCGLVVLVAVQQGNRRVTGVPFRRIYLRADCHFRDHLNDDNDDDEGEENDEDDDGVYIYVYICII